MRKLALLIGFILMCSVARAEFSLGDTLKGFPALKQGVAFSLQDSNWNYLSTTDLVKWKGINLEAGLAADAENTGWKAVAVLSYDLLNIKKFIDIPILNLIEFRPGVWVGLGRIEGFEDGQIQGEGDYGISLSVISVKF